MSLAERDIQPHLFELPKFNPKGFAMAYTSANNVRISEDEAEILKAAVLDDPDQDQKLLCAKVFFTVKGYKTEYGRIVFNAVVADCALELD